MSQTPVLLYQARAAEEKPAARSFLRHAKLIGGLTLASRIMGLGREIAAGHYMGTGLVASAFTVAFTIPNLFRKLFGEGALSAAFIPLYTQAVKLERDGPAPRAGLAGNEVIVPSAADKSVESQSLAVIHSAGETASGVNLVQSRQPAASPTENFALGMSGNVPDPIVALPSSNSFAAAAVNMLCALLLVVTVGGEAGLLAIIYFSHDMRPERLLTVKLTAVMLPYVLMICGGAFLSGILQVHKRFGPPAAAPIILNAIHILVLLIGAKMLHMSITTDPRQVVVIQTKLAYLLGGFVLVAGMLQVWVLLPALKAVGFRFQPTLQFWTPAVRRMLWLSLPVALGAGVLQISVLLDKGISMLLMQGVDIAGRPITTFQWFGHIARLPMAMGAPRRLDLAQFLYQFPLGIFAIALATAIFPHLSSEALEKDRNRFRTILRHGIEAALWEGLPASVGLAMIRMPAVRLLFQHGQVSATDATLIGSSVLYYASAIWAFSVLQIVNRAYYAIHDTFTPLVMAIVNIILNLVVEIPLLWYMGESAMAVGTAVSFGIQTVIMLWMLDRKVGGLDLRRSAPRVLKMGVATAIMGLACHALQRLPCFPHGADRASWAAQLLFVAGVGVITYLTACWAMRLNMMGQLRAQPHSAAPSN